MLILPDGFLEWSLIHELYCLTSFDSSGCEFTLTAYLPFPHLLFAPIPCSRGSLHAAHTHSALNNCPESVSENQWVILLSSLPECSELSVYVAQGQPPCLTLSPSIPASRASSCPSYLCTSEGKPQGRKFAFWRGGFKVLRHLLRGKCPSKPLDPCSHFFFSFFPEMNFIMNTPSSPEAMVSLTANPLLHSRTEGPLARWLLNFVMIRCYAAQALSRLWTSCLEVCRCAAVQCFLTCHRPWRGGVWAPHGAISLTVCDRVVMIHKPENWRIAVMTRHTLLVLGYQAVLPRIHSCPP